MTPKKLSPRKLLVAAIGVATINYVVACQTPPTPGNLPGPEPVKDPSMTLPTPPPTTLPPTTGNLPAPPPVHDAAARLPPTSGNLPAPMPADAGPSPRVAPTPTAPAKK